jgi:hypothetical protein
MLAAENASAAGNTNPKPSFKGAVEPRMRGIVVRFRPREKRKTRKEL